MKKIVSLLLVVICLFSAVSCGEANEIKEKVLSITADELLGKLVSANAEGEMYSYSASLLADELGITEDLYTAGKFFVPVESAGVESVAFFTASSKENASKIKDALDSYIARVKNVQEKYNAANFEVAKAAVAVKEGLNVYLVMSPSKDALVKIINDYLK